MAVPAMNTFPPSKVLSFQDNLQRSTARSDAGFSGVGTLDATAANNTFSREPSPPFDAVRRQEAMQLFDSLDKNHNGVITREELRAALNDTRAVSSPATVFAAPLQRSAQPQLFVPTSAAVQFASAQPLQATIGPPLVTPFASVPNLSPPMTLPPTPATFNYSAPPLSMQFTSPPTPSVNLVTPMSAQLYPPVSMAPSMPRIEASPPPTMQPSMNMAGGAYMSNMNLNPEPVQYSVERPALSNAARGRSAMELLPPECEGSWMNVQPSQGLEWPNRGVRVEPAWIGDQWWVVAPVDWKGLNERDRYDPLMSKHYTLDGVDDGVRQMDFEGQLPQLPQPRHWKNDKGCPIA